MFTCLRPLNPHGNILDSGTDHYVLVDRLRKTATCKFAFPSVVPCCMEPQEQTCEHMCGETLSTMHAERKQATMETKLHRHKSGVLRHTVPFILHPLADCVRVKSKDSKMRSWPNLARPNLATTCVSVLWPNVFLHFLGVPLCCGCCACSSCAGVFQRCVQGFWVCSTFWVCSKCFGGGPPPDHPKCCSFSLSRCQISFFLPSLGVLSWNCGRG